MHCTFIYDYSAVIRRVTKPIRWDNRVVAKLLRNLRMILSDAVWLWRFCKKKKRKIFLHPLLELFIEIRDDYMSVYVPLTVGKQIGLMALVSGTRSLSLMRATSLSNLRKLKSPVIARTTNRVSSGASPPLHVLCSPKVTLIMNHMNLKIKLTNEIDGSLLLSQR